MNGPRVTVLVCTCDRPAMLRRALESVLHDTTEKPDEIVVVNGGDARADEVVHELQRRAPVPIVLLKTVNRNLAASRNIGLRACSGEIVAMTDDDAEVFPDWVARLKELHARHPEAGAIGGAVLGGTSASSLLSRISDVVTFPHPEKAGYVRTLPGVNISYKREVLSRLGDQDETLFRGEDVDYNWRVQCEGYKVLYEPSMQVIHHHRPTLRHLLRQHYMYGRAYYLVRRKWKEMYCVYPHAIRQPRDLARAAMFVAGTLVEPFRTVRRFQSVRDRFAAFPVLILCQCSWRLGMAAQAYRETSAGMRRKPPVPSSVTMAAGEKSA